MGSNVQEVFQGRGDKKGKGFLLKRVLPLFSLAALWAGLLLDLPLKSPVVWFSFSSLVAASFSAAHLLSKKKEFSLGFLFSLGLVFQGLIISLGFPSLRFVYFPLLVSVPAFYGLNSTLPLSLLIPLLGIRNVLSGGSLLPEVVFSLSLILSGLLSALVVATIRKEKEKAVSSLDAIRTGARDITLETGMESLGSEEVMSHYFASFLKTDEEIQELLTTIKNAVFADSASLFVPEGEGYSLRCSTDDKADVAITGRGVIPGCLRDKRVFFASDLADTNIEPGYTKPGRISSVLAVPVLDGPRATGVLVADSPRFQAFSQTEQNTVRMFAAHLGRILERERIYMMIKRDVFGLRLLKEESSNLVSSLNTDIIVRKLCVAGEKIAPSRIFFLLSKGSGYTLAYGASAQGSAENAKVYDISGTFINMAVENSQAIYVSDVTHYRIPILPFRTERVKSAFVVPLIYERRVLGLFIMISGDRNFLDTFQTDMLKVICNQAATSLANARLHEEIEKMATTDGLTGLYNHRVFQEKLSSELRRLNRFSGPVSLLLIDIDFFKKVNDTYGHPAGDKVLKEVAGAIRGGIREIDIPARYGGEEFAVILPGTDSAAAHTISERLRKDVSARPFSEGNRTFSVSVSIGIAACPSDAKTKEELIERADQALYEAKRNGRNQSVLSGGAA